MRLSTLTFLLLLSSKLVFSQAVTPFTCESFAYLFQNRPTDIIQIDLQTGIATEVASNLFGEDVSAGYNRADNFIYLNGKKTGNLYKVDKNWNFTTYTLGINTGLYNADIDANGIMYMYKGNSTSIIRYDLNVDPPAQISSLTTTKTGIADYAFNPIDGFLYGVDNKGRVYQFNPATGAQTLTTTVTGLDSQTYGAVYFDANGTLYLNGNSNGKIFTISHSTLTTGSPSNAVFFSQATKSGTNDGARCVTAPLCKVGDTAPNLSSTSISNDCGETSVNLGTISANNTPDGTILTWHSGTPPSNGNKLSDLNITSSGTYYATFYDAENDCYSASNTPITVTIVSVPTTPTAISASSISICEGASSDLSGTCSLGTINWYQNNTSGTLIGTGSPLTVSPSSTTNYVATCKTTSPNCESSPSSAITVTLNPKPTPPSITAGNTQICEGNSTKLTATGCSGTVNWSSGETGASVTVSPTVTTIYTATCTNTTTNCVSSNSNSVTVTVVSSSGVTVSIDKNTICNGEAVNLLMSNCAGLIAWYEVGNLIPIGTSATLSQSPTSTTAYNATCNGIEAAYCSSSSSNNIDVSVNDVPTAPSISITGNSTICTGETTTLEATGCAGTVSWSNSQTGTTITVSPSVSPTTYTATCTVNGCTSPNSTGVDVTVNPLPNAPSGISPINICSGQSTSLNGTCSGGSTLTWYQETALTNLVTLPVSPSNTATYYGVCTENGCSSASTSIKVSVTATPTAPSDISATSTSICEGKSVVIGSSCSGTANLKWFTDALLINELASTIVSPTSTSTYYAACQNGTCLSASKNITITVSPAPAAPTALSTSTAICKGDSRDLLGTCASGTTIQWYLSVISPSTLLGTTSPLNVSPTETTIYIATCKNNSTNCESPKGPDVVISVKDRPSSPKNLSATPSSICSGESSNLAANCSTGTLTWYEDAGLTTVTASTVSPTSTTTYYASCVLSSCQSVSGSITVTVSPTPAAPTAVSASTVSVCEGETSVLSATCATGTLTWYSDASLSTIVGSTVSPAVTSTYFASCVSGSCKSVSGSVEITVTAIPSSPTAVAAAPAVLCEGGSTTLSASCSSGSLTWYTDENLSSLLGSSTVSPTSTTTYYASCVDGICKSPYVSQTVEVNELPAAPTIAPSSRDLCEGSSVVLTASGCVGNITWSNAKTTASITETPTVTTDYSATCTNPNTGCVSPVSAVTTITVVTPPMVPSISADKTQLCLGEAITLTSFNCTGDSPVVNWFESTNSIGSGTSISHTPTASGAVSYTANCVTTSTEAAVQCESGAAEPIDLIVNALPNIPSISTTDNTICEGESTTLEATNCGSGSVKWSDGQTGNSITVSPTSNTDYQAVCVLNGCESDKSVVLSIQVTAIPEAPTALAGPAICSGASSTLSGTCTNGSSISWFSDAALTTSVSSPVSPTETTTYYAVCTLNTCKSSTASHIVEVTETPSAPSSTSASPATVCAGDRSELSGACTLGNLVWYEDAALNTTLASTIVNPTNTTTYYAACENGACKSLAASQVINVNPLPAAPTLSADETTICEGSSSILTAASCTGTVTWSTGETGNNITVSPNRTSIYTATCTDANSCTSANSLDLTITVILPPSEPTITNSSASICPGGSSTLTAVGCNDGVSWYESGSSSSFATTTSVILSPAITTGYFAVCESPGATCPSIESDEEPIIVKAVPTITDIITPSCNDASNSMIAFQTSRGSSSTVSVSNSLTASFDNDGRENDSRTVWVIENIPNSTNFTVTVNENGCETSKNYSTIDCSTAASGSFPLKIVSFSGKKVNGEAELEWTVSDEAGVSHFQIERSSNAISFEKIGKEKALNLKEKHSYSFIDKSPKESINYYRLKSKDLDGATSFSKIIAIDFRETDALNWSLYPNPVEAGSRELNIQTKGRTEDLEFRLFNMNGIGIKVNSAKISSTAYKVEFGDIPAGTYFLQAENSKDISTKKFIKLH